MGHVRYSYSCCRAALEQGMTDEFDHIVGTLLRVHGQPFIGHVIMLILDLYLEGIVPILSPDLITARMN